MSKKIVPGGRIDQDLWHRFKVQAAIENKPAGATLERAMELYLERKSQARQGQDQGQENQQQ